MQDWVCFHCGKRVLGQAEPAACPVCYGPMIAESAIARPEDAVQVRIDLGDLPNERAISAGPPPFPLPSDFTSKSISIEDQPTRYCAKCGSLMTMFLCENAYIYGTIPAGKRMHYRCTACEKEIKLRSLGRIFLISLVCPFFTLFAWIWLRYGGLGPLLFALVQSVAPIVLVMELVTRFRYARAGGGLARSLGNFTINADPPAVYDTLFGDLPLGRWPEGSPAAFPWSEFVQARIDLAEGRRDEAFEHWREVVAHQELETRHHLQAWHFLRQFGQQPPQEIAHHVLGVVVELGMPQGRESPALSAADIMVVYADRSARYYNFSGAGIVWEHRNDSLNPIIDRLLTAGTDNIAAFEPWNVTRRPPPGAGQVRLSLLTPSGLYLRQGMIEAVETNPVTSALMQAAAQLLPALMNKAIHSEQSA